MSPRTYAEKVETWNSPDVPGVTFGTVEDTNREWKMYNDRYHLSVITASPGRARYFVRGTEGRMEVGSIFLLEPGDTYRVEAGSDGGASRGFFIPTEVMIAAAAELDPAWTSVSFPVLQVRDEELWRLLMEFGDAISQPSSTLERQSLFGELLHYLLTHHAGKAPSGNTARYGGPLDRAADLIRERLSGPVSLDELAQAAGLPRFKFLRAFKRRFALTPHDYQVKARLAKAQELLQAGESIAHVAVEAGFADQSHFTRHFKRAYVLTPGEFWKR